ncbi:MAG: CapA family protein [Desulfuromonadaceae bacterium]|nr:CapA family protein [Desulfuromonadaceae bacterium]MDD5104817.1 CapA family protein [Desulfuromonadaceae bacterium]
MKNESINLLAVGDIFLADTPLKTGCGVKDSIYRNGKDYFVEKIKTIIDGHDICFGNIESVLSDKGRNVYDISSVEIRGKSDFTDIISRSGFNVVNIANNHIFQHGMEPYIDTIDNLASKGVKIIGDDYSNRNFATFELNGFVIGFVGYSLHYEQYHPMLKAPYSLRENADDILRDIQKIRTSFNGLLVCSLHWGYEFMDSISLEQRELCHKLVDCGVTIILGHHSHAPQGIEEYNGGLIAYSLGNFIFDMDADPANKSFALVISINSNGIAGSKIVPIEIKDDYCPYLMNKSQSDQFIAKIHNLSSNIRSGACLPDVQMEAIQQKISGEIYRTNYKNFFKNFFKTNVYYNIQIILRALMRRIGIAHSP